MKYKILILVVIITLTLFKSGWCQEVLLPTECNPVIREYVRINGFPVRLKNLSDTLELPFYDDFSRISIYPNSELWSDNDVYINDSYQLNPPTNGVATFDALGADGNMQSNANSSSFISDYLTSLPINLKNYSGGDTTSVSSNNLYIYNGSTYNYYSDSLYFSYITDSFIVVTAFPAIIESNTTLYHNTLTPILDSIMLLDSTMVIDTVLNDTTYLIDTTYLVDTIGFHSVKVPYTDSLYYFNSFYNDYFPLFGEIIYDNFVKDSIFMSFFFQPQGLGFIPEKGDSLVLKFYSPVDGNWYSAWSEPGDSLRDFIQVIIQIDSARYFHKGFKFRFYNYASMAGINLPSLAGNNDTWNIDLVYLNRNRGVNDTSIADVAFIDRLKYPLENYTSMPWTHFQANDQEETLLLNSTFMNYMDIPYHVTHKYDLWNDAAGVAYLNKAVNATDDAINTVATYGGLLTEMFDSSIPGQGNVFNIKAYLDVPNVIFPDYKRWNDTINHVQVFDNYYAYDDGTAEGGYGLAGGGSENGMVAYKFYNYKGDTLRAVNMFFNHTLNNANQKYFYLTIWKDNNGKPGDIIWKQEDMHVTYSDSLNEFTTFDIKVSYPDTLPLPEYYLPAGEDTVIFIPEGETYYIGWQKIVTEDMLNVGFDKNTITSGKLFYTYSGAWVESSMQGALMIRPVMGGESVLSVDETPLVDYNVKVWPNPASNNIQIDYTDGMKNTRSETMLFDGYGRMVFKSSDLVQSIDLNGLANGFYLLKITDYQNYDITRKIVVLH